MLSGRPTQIAGIVAGEAYLAVAVVTLQKY